MSSVVLPITASLTLLAARREFTRKQMTDHAPVLSGYWLGRDGIYSIFHITISLSFPITFGCFQFLPTWSGAVGYFIGRVCLTFGNLNWETDDRELVVVSRDALFFDSEHGLNEPRSISSGIEGVYCLSTFTPLNQDKIQLI